MIKRSLYLLMICCLAVCLQAHAKSSVLDKKVTLVFSNITLEQALKQISDNYYVRFSYVNNLVPLQTKVSLTARDKSLGDALDKLFENTYIVYYAVGKHIVLKHAKKEIKQETSVPKSLHKIAYPNKPIKPLDYTTSDRLIADAESRMTEIDARIRTLDSLAYQETQADSVNRMRLQHAIALQMDKIKSSTRNLVEGFNNAIDSLSFGNGMDTTKSKRWNDELQKVEKKTVKFFMRVDNKLDSISTNKNLGNAYSMIPDSNGYYHRPFQFTFFTPLGTNGLQSPWVINNVSINLLFGINGGVDGVEFAGFANIDRTDVHGIQFAGFGNTTGGDMGGVQGAGFFNVAAGQANGFQGAGFFNVNGKSMSGAQGAGFFNVNGGSLTGVQGAGFFNVNGGDVKGVMGAGFINITGGNVKGVQGAGFINVAGKKVQGFQGAGFINVAKEVDGMQGAGFINVAKNVKGAQVAGFINVAKNVKGTQIGFLNVADTLDGIPFGFLSFVKKGYKKIDVFANEVLPVSAAFRTGAPLFHNIIGIGVNPFKGNDSYVSIIYGVGTDLKINSKLTTSIDVLAHDIRFIATYPNNATNSGVNNYGQLRVNIVYSLTDKIALFAGPAFSVYVTDYLNPDTGKYGMDLAPYAFYDRTRNGYNLKMWVGGSLGVRFL